MKSRFESKHLLRNGRFRHKRLDITALNLQISRRRFQVWKTRRPIQTNRLLPLLGRENLGLHLRTSTGIDLHQESHEPSGHHRSRIINKSDQHRHHDRSKVHPVGEPKFPSLQPHDRRLRKTRLSSNCKPKAAPKTRIMRARIGMDNKNTTARTLRGVWLILSGVEAGVADEEGAGTREFIQRSDLVEEVE